MMTEPGPPHDASLTRLLKDAVEQSQQLVKLEVQLAKQDVTQQLETLKSTALLLGVGLGGGLMALSVGLVALLLAMGASAWVMLIVAAALLVGAVGISFVAAKRLPRPAERTLERLKKDAAILKEHVV